VFGCGMAQEPEHGDPVLGGGGEHQRAAAAGDAPPFGDRVVEIRQVGNRRDTQDSVENRSLKR